MKHQVVIDGGQPFDWGRTSDDYATFRPGPPESLFERLTALGVGHPGQRILDLATGTGVMPRGFARRGATAVGIDIAGNQIAAARRLSAPEELSGVIAYAVARAEALPFPDRSFDAVAANQCWLYFDAARTVAEVRRVVGPGGLLTTSHFSWLPDADPIARVTEDLVLRYNPGWTGARWDGTVALHPKWAGPELSYVGGFVYDESIPFTPASWRGRIRACRGVGASLRDADVAMFDREHAALLATMAGDRFTVLHRIDARVLRFTR